MSFGIGIGDFVAVLQLTNKIRKDFIGAPDALKAISSDIRGFSIVLQDAEVSCGQFSENDIRRLDTVVSGSRALLDELRMTLEKHSEIASTGRHKGVKRIWKRLKWEPDDIRDLRSRIATQVSILSSFNERITREGVSKLLHSQQDAHRHAILEWISPIDYASQQTDLVSRRQPGSRRWLLESPEYSAWLGHRGKVLFCPGNPGAGKTFTTAVVVENLQEISGNDADTLTSYVYCNYRSQEQSVGKLLCSLLRISLQSLTTVPGTVQRLHQRYRPSGQALSRIETTQLLRDLFSGFKRVNVLVDGLDELPYDVRRPFITELLKLQRHADLNLLVTSRDIPEIHRPFSNHGAVSIEIQASDEDVRDFLTDHLFLLPGFVSRSSQLQEDIVSEIAAASTGMFLLAELHLRSLVGKKSATALRTTLARLAKGSSAYDDAYREAMERIESQGADAQELAKQALLILSCAKVALLTTDLAYALSLEPESQFIDAENVPDIEDVVSVCAGLVTIDEESNVVRLVHRSTQEYFERHRSRWFPRANAEMLRLCTQYLNLASSICEAESLPFYEYAKSHWGHHAYTLEAEEEMTSMDPAGSDSGSVARVDSIATSRFGLIQMVKELGNVDSAIIAACRNGHQGAVELLLNASGYDLNQGTKRPVIEDLRFENSRGEDELPNIKPVQDDVLLTIAAASGNIGITDMLLKRGADPNTVSSRGQTALFIAAERGHENLVSLLLDQHATDPDARCHCLPGEVDPLDVTTHEILQLNPLQIASERGNLGCVKLLLERSANPGSTDGHDRNAMWYAAARGRSDIVTELLKCPEIDIDKCAQSNGETPLAAAIRRGKAEAASILIPLANRNLPDGEGQSPLCIAVFSQCDEIIRALLCYDDVDMDRTIPLSGNTALMAALSLGYTEGIKLLLPKSNINYVRVRDRRTAIHVAVASDNVQLARLVLEQPGVEIDAIDQTGSSPFMLAASRRQGSMMKLLIEHGSVGFGQKASYMARARPYILDPAQDTEVVRWIISQPECDINWQDEMGRSCLHIACRSLPENGRIPKERDQFFEILLGHPAIDVNLPDSDGNAPLFSAISTKSKSAVEALLRHKKVDVTILGQHGNTLLQAACSAYSPNLPPLQKTLTEDIFFTVLRHSETEICHKNSSTEAVLALAARDGSSNMVQALLMSPSMASRASQIFANGMSILSYAVVNRADPKVLELLLGHFLPSHLDHRDVHGRTTLHYAALARNGAGILSILRRGSPRVDLYDNSGRSPLDYAAYNCDPGVIMALLLKKPGIKVNFLDARQLAARGCVLTTLKGNKYCAWREGDEVHGTNRKSVYESLLKLNQGRINIPVTGAQPLWTWVVDLDAELSNVKSIDVVLRQPRCPEAVDWALGRPCSVVYKAG